MRFDEAGKLCQQSNMTVIEGFVAALHRGDFRDGIDDHSMKDYARVVAGVTEDEWLKAWLWPPPQLLPNLALLLQLTLIALLAVTTYKGYMAVVQ